MPESHRHPSDQEEVHDDDDLNLSTGMRNTQRSGSPSSTTVSNVTSEGGAATASGIMRGQQSLQSQPDGRHIVSGSEKPRQGGFTLSHAAQVLRPDVLRASNGGASAKAGQSFAGALSPLGARRGVDAEGGYRKNTGSRSSAHAGKAGSGDQQALLQAGATDAWVRQVSRAPSQSHMPFHGGLSAALSGSASLSKALASTTPEPPAWTPQHLAMLVSQLPDDILAPGAKEKLIAAAAMSWAAPDQGRLQPASRPVLLSQLQQHNLSNVSCAEHFDPGTHALSDHGGLYTVKSDTNTTAPPDLGQLAAVTASADAGEGPCVSLSQAMQAAVEHPETLPEGGRDVESAAAGEDDYATASGATGRRTPARDEKGREGRRRALTRHKSMPPQACCEDGPLEFGAKRMRSDPAALRAVRSRLQRDDAAAMPPPPEPLREQPGILALLPMVAQLAVFADGGVIGVWSRCTQSMLNSPATRALFRVALRMWGAGLRVHTLAPLLQLQAQLRA